MSLVAAWRRFCGRVHSRPQIEASCRAASWWSRTTGNSPPLRSRPHAWSVCARDWSQHASQASEQGQDVNPGVDARLLAVSRETEHVKRFTLAPAPGFRFLPGQWVSAMIVASCLTPLQLQVTNAVRRQCGMKHLVRWCLCSLLHIVG